MQVRQAREKYVRWLLVTRDLSPHTIRAYDADITALERHLGTRASVRAFDQERLLAFEEFSYVSELVTHDGAIAALTELARVVDLLPGVVEGPWEQVRPWLADRLSDTWQARGPYPGMGPMLAAAGIERGALLARRVLDALPEGTSDPWPQLERAVAENRDGLVGRVARQAFAHLVADEERYRQLRIMSRFGFTGAQARELFAALAPQQVIANPYLLYEAGAAAESVAFSTIDRGLWPQDADARAALAADPIDEPVAEASDDRRVRAASIDVLERAAGAGHTLLDEPQLRRRLEQGGGPAGALVSSDESMGAPGIDSSAVRELARRVFGSATSVLRD